MPQTKERMSRFDALEQKEARLRRFDELNAIDEALEAQAVAPAEELKRSGLTEAQEEAIAAAPQAQGRLEQLKQAISGLSAEQAETFVRSALSGLTAGISEPLISGIAALGPQAAEVLAQPMATDIPSGLSIPEAEAAFAADVERRRELEAEYPKTALAGQLAGAVAPGSVGGKLAGLAGKAVAPLGKLAAGQAPGAVRAAASQIAQGAAQAGLSTGAEAAIRKAALEPTGFVKEGEEASVLEQAALASKVGGGAAALPWLARGAVEAGKYALGSATRVSKESIETFLADSARINAALPKEEIVDRVQVAAAKLQNTLAKEKVDLLEASALGLAALKERTIAESKKALDIAAESGAKFRRKDIIDMLSSARERLEQPGRTGEANEAAKAALDNFISKVKADVPEVVSGPVVKRIIESLDDDILQKTGGFLSYPGQFAKTPMHSALLSARGALDGFLKDRIPAYKTQIAQAHKFAQIHEEAFKVLGTPEKAFSTLSSLGAPKSVIKDKNVEKFFKASGVDPERYREAQAAAAGFEKWSDFASAESKVAGFLSGRKSAIGRQMNRLATLAKDTDLIRDIETLKIANEFEKQIFSGSRSVLFWGLLGAAGGGMMDEQIGGGALGGTVGAMMDVHGPAITRSILQSVVNMRGIPTVQKIRQFQLPPKVRDELEQGFVRAMVTTKRKETSEEVPYQARQSFIQEIIDTDQLTSVEKARMISEINKHGRVTGFKKVLLGKDSAAQGAKNRFEPFEPKKESRPAPAPEDILKNISNYQKGKKPDGL